jgi:UDP-N-acetyl-D-glucosamine/UDP-N-acetyl-D-galactosamine dehydrogenase
VGTASSRDPAQAQGFYVGYSPERINPGDKEHRVSTIQKVTSGSTPEIAETIDAIYREIITAGTHKAESIRVAEAAKVIENTQRDLNIALMNELSVLFARLGIDTEAVLRAAGTKWNFLPFRPGLVGGHCISVDPYYLTEKAERVGYIPQIILAGRRINDNMGRYVARTTLKKMIQNGCDVTKATIGVLGLTFKENCPDLRNSRVIDIIHELQDYGVNVIAEDPYADSVEVAHEYPGVTLGAVNADNPVDALVVAVAHDVYAGRDARALRMLLRGERPVLADVKSLYDRRALAEVGLTVWRL